MIRRIYLDTNPLVQSGWPKLSAQLERAFEFARLLKIEVYLPEPVLDELRGQWSRDFTEKQQSLSGYVSKVRQRAQTVGSELEPFPSIVMPDLMRAYDETVAVTVSKWNLLQIPYTERSISEIFQTSVYRKAPFLPRDKGDAGFKDAVILFSIEDHLKGHLVEAALVTSDGRFQEKPVLQVIEAQGLQLTVLDGIDAVDRELKSHIVEKLREAMADDEMAALAFLTSQRAQIEQFVTENLELSLHEFSSSPGYKLDEVSRTEMDQILKATISPSRWERKDTATVKITFEAHFDFHLHWTRLPFGELVRALSNSTLKVGGKVAFREESDEGEPAATARRLLQIEGTAEYSKGCYSSLACTRASIKYLPGLAR